MNSYWLYEVLCKNVTVNQKKTATFEFYGKKLFLTQYPTRREYLSAVYLTYFFDTNSVAVPKPILASRMTNTIISEHVAGQPLISLRREILIESLKKSILLLNKIHSLRPRVEFLFAKRLKVSWLDYMLENIKRLCPFWKREFKNWDDFEKELSILKKKLSKAKECAFLHMDYQSRNLILSGKKIYVTDFERARYGCCLWDLASLLFQPSLNLKIDQIEGLAGIYLKKTEYSFNDLLCWAIFRLVRGVERRLQTFRERGSEYFTSTMDPALSVLISACEALDLPNLSRSFCCLRGGLIYN
ncbi:MAG: phosphotransferase [Deltaproteobacteria bacterium]|nr:phosphotransferase [Deltaproteobacteria bacterium]